MSVLDKSRPMLIYISQRWAEVDKVAEKKSENCRINKLETTDDTLTSRGGLTFFVKYVGSVGVLGLLLEKFMGIKKSAKGVSVGNLFLQALYFFFDGTSRHLSYFDELKKVKGLQPLHLIWEGKIVDAIFRRGKRHSNYGNDVGKMIRGIVRLIRARYSASVDIVIRMDAGFFDEKNFELCDELGIHFIGTGKAYEAIKEQVAAIVVK